MKFKHSYPMFFDGLIEYTKPAEANAALPDVDFKQWLGEIISRADWLVNKSWLASDESKSYRPYSDVKNAALEAQKALQYFEHGNTQWALVSAFAAGRAVEAANRAIPLHDHVAYQDGTETGRWKQERRSYWREKAVLGLYTKLVSDGTNPINAGGKIEAKLKSRKRLKLGRSAIDKILAPVRKE